MSTRGEEMPNLTVKQVNILAKGQHSKTSDGNGLSFVVPKRGEPYWSLRYSVNGKRREKSLGNARQITLAEARGLAEEERTKLREGLDPLSKFAGSVLNIRSMDELFNDYYQNKLLRLVHPNIPKRKYQNDISPYIGNMDVSNINPIHVRSIIKSIADSKRPCVSNDVLDLLNNLFKHATQLGLTLNNPASVFSYLDAGGQEEPRTRFLTLDEIKPVYETFRQHPESFTRDNYLACCLLLVLGVRKNELLQAPWAEFDLTNAVWHLPKNRTKKKYKGIDIPLPPIALEWLQELKIRGAESDYVFPARRRSKKPYMGSDTLNRAIDGLFGIAQGKKTPPPNRMGDIGHFTVHDLRRTFRSLVSMLGYSGELGERCLNHKISRLDDTYNKYDYFEERKEVHIKVSEALSTFF